MLRYFRGLVILRYFVLDLWLLLLLGLCWMVMLCCFLGCLLGGLGLFGVVLRLIVWFLVDGCSLLDCCVGVWWFDLVGARICLVG